MTPGRSKKLGLDYFPFDVDFFNDDKVVCIAGEFGIKGELTIIKLLCAVYKNGYFLEWSEQLQFSLLRTLPGVSLDLLNQIVSRLVRWGFFDASLFDSVKVLSSVGIQRRYFHAARGRVKKDDYPYLLISPKYTQNGQIGISDKEMPISDKEMPINYTEIDKVKENINNNNNNRVREHEHDSFALSEPPCDEPPCDETSEPPSLDNEIVEMSLSEIWLDAISKKHNLGQDEVIRLFDEFREECLCNGIESHTDLADAKFHFNHWLKKRKQNDRPGNIKTGNSKVGIPIKGKVNLGYGLEQ